MFLCYYANRVYKGIKMLNITFDKEFPIVTLEPEGALSQSDFETATKIIDPFIKIHGKLKGIIIETESFPGWKDFSALIEHLTFIRNHHKKVKRIAFVTNSVAGTLSEHITSHFVSAEVKSFPYGQHKEARDWILESK
jgi:hypothetical protein